MRIAIHNSEKGFHPRWVVYCKNNKIAYKIVNCYDSDIIEQLRDCDSLMWHFNHASPKDFLFANKLLYSLQSCGKSVFPDFNTMWHFDDKVGQKYLLESIGAPMVPSYVFYSKKKARQWLSKTDYPKVFKLRGGAGSQNVKLAKTKSDALKLIKRSFSSGFSQYDGWSNFKERLRKYDKGQTSLFDLVKGFIRLVYTTEFSKTKGKENGYAYFQKFIPNNDSDIRVIVIDEKAFAIKRMVRENDFRASGSGTILYDKELFDEGTIKLALDTAKTLKSQCVAFDFVYQNNKPLIIEISYGFSTSGYDECPGYWDKEMNWHKGSFNPYGWMIEGVIKIDK